MLLLYRHGCTHVTVSDQGRKFVNRVNAVLFQLTGTEHRISTAYHPQTNGLVVHYNQTLHTIYLFDQLSEDETSPFEMP